MKLRKKAAALMTAFVFVGVAAATMGTASAARPDRVTNEFSFEVVDGFLSEVCGAPIHVAADVRVSTMFRETHDGALLVTEQVHVDQVITNLDTGKSTTVKLARTFHVAIGAGTDGRDTVKLTGVEHSVTPGSGSATQGTIVQGAGHFAYESFGPEGVRNRIMVEIHGLFDVDAEFFSTDPLPPLCETLS